MVEGDLWRYAHTDLTDFYAGRLTLRQIYVRWIGLPAEANIWAALNELVQKDEANRKAADIDAALNMFGGQRG